MPMSESPALCIRALLTDSERLAASEKISRLRKLVIEFQSQKRPATQSEAVLFSSWSVLPPEPPENDPCHDYWLLWGAAVLDAYTCSLAYGICRQQHPLPGGTVTATAKPEPPIAR